MATTPIFAIPYPVGTDRVMDGDNAMQALAERVETILAPTGTPLPYQNGWHDYGSGYEAATYQRIGRLVVLQGLASPAGSTSLGICTLPPGFRPAGTVLASGLTDFGPQRLDILTTGAISASSTASVNFLVLTGICFLVAGPVS